MRIESIFNALQVPALVVIASAVALPAQAQIWVWKDEKNRTVSSDQPPPPSIPLKNIVRAPRSASPPRGISDAAPGPVTAGVAGAVPSVAGKPPEAPKTTAEKELEFRKRQKEAADAAKKQEDDAAKAKALAERCKALRENLAGLESGVRIARVRENGEREYLDDAQRQSEIDKTRSASADCK